MLRTTLLLLSLVCVCCCQKCNIPPRLWCTSVETARSCGVQEQCRFYKSSQNSLNAAPPVQVALYYESLCPGCRNFIQSQLYPTWQQLSDLITFSLKEHQIGDEWQFECQHGVNECIGNVIETCTLYYNEIKTAFPVIACMEANAKPYDAQVGQQCASQYSVDYSTILKCSNSTLGNKLEHQMALKTDALNPPHTYTPWVTLNGVHTEDIQTEAQNNLLKLVCDTYTGKKPAACTMALDVCYNY
ncbi:gamma-interferon-inducible lysosomal thiol reductase-like [Saccoglossus kowalevskii]